MKTSRVLLMVMVAAGVLGVTAHAPSVWASPITYDFTLTLPGCISPVFCSGGPLAGTVERGSFTFDSSVIPADGFGIVDQQGLFTHFSFSWNGTTYNQTTANAVSLGFGGYPFLGAAPAGTLTSFVFGDNCVNPENTCFVVNNTDTWRATEGVSVDPDTHMVTIASTFFYALSGVPGVWGDVGPTSFQPNGPIVISRVPSVPEPSLLSLLFVGLALVGLVRRAGHAPFAGCRNRQWPA